VDAVARVEDEGFHLGVPALGLMAKMDARVQQFLNSDRSRHVSNFPLVSPLLFSRHPAEHRIFIWCCYGFHRRRNSAKTASHEAETVFPRAKTSNEERREYQKKPLPQLLFWHGWPRKNGGRKTPAVDYSPPGSLRQVILVGFVTLSQFLKNFEVKNPCIKKGLTSCFEKFNLVIFSRCKLNS
jgi:hypothetical protein